MFKMISVLFRKEENSTEEFRHNSDTKHVPLMKSICIIRLYCRMSFQGTSPRAKQAWPPSIILTSLGSCGWTRSGS